MITMGRSRLHVVFVALGVTGVGACSVLTDLDGLQGGSSAIGDASTLEGSVASETGAPSEAGGEASTNDGGADGGADDGATTDASVAFCDGFPGAIACSDFESPPITRGFGELALTGSGAGAASTNQARSGPTSFRSFLPGSGVAGGGAELKTNVSPSLGAVRLLFHAYLDGAPTSELELASWQSTGGRQFVVTVAPSLTRLCAESPSTTRSCIELPLLPRNQCVRVQLTMTGIKAGAPTAKLALDGVDVATRTFDPFTTDYQVLAFGYWNLGGGAGTVYVDDVVIDVP